MSVVSRCLQGGIGAAVMTSIEFLPAILLWDSVQNHDNSLR